MIRESVEPKLQELWERDKTLAKMIKEVRDVKR